MKKQETRSLIRYSLFLGLLFLLPLLFIIFVAHAQTTSQVIGYVYPVYPENGSSYFNYNCYGTGGMPIYNTYNSDQNIVFPMICKNGASAPTVNVNFTSISSNDTGTLYCSNGSSYKFGHSTSYPPSTCSAPGSKIRINMPTPTNTCTMTPSSASPGQQVIVGNAQQSPSGGYGLNVQFTGPASSNTTGFFVTTSQIFSMSFPAPSTPGNYSVNITQSGTNVCGNNLNLNVSNPVSNPNPTITVTKSGMSPSAGFVAGGGISCGTTCSIPVTSGSSLTLTATSDAGTTFTGWGGACSGTWPTCTLTVNANTSVSAKFDPGQPVITSINPTNAEPGTAIAIFGTGFTAANNTLNLLTPSTGAIVWTKTQAKVSPDGTLIAIDLPTTISPGTYNVQVSNVDGTSNSLPITIDEDSTAPKLTGEMSLSTDNGAKVDLAWTPDPKNAGIYTGYEIEKSTDDNKTFSVIYRSSADARSYADNLEANAITTSAESYRIRGKFPDGSYSDYSEILPFSNCFDWSGNGSKYIVFIEDGTRVPIAGDYVTEVRSIVNKFESVDPFKTYKDKFAFFIDLKAQSSASFDKYSIGGSTFFKNPEQTLISNSSCPALKSATYIYLTNDHSIWGYTSTDSNAVREIGNVIFMNTPALSEAGLDASVVAVHELGHAIGKLDDEYLDTDPMFGEPWDMYNTIGELEDSLENCSDVPSLDYWDEVSNVIYASTSIQGCHYVSTSEGFEYYRPSENSIMNDDSESQSFNVISCGYLVSAILGEPLYQAYAEAHWPAIDRSGNPDVPKDSLGNPIGCGPTYDSSGITRQGPMNTDVADIPPIDLITPSITKISASVFVPGSTLAVSASGLQQDQFPANGNLFDKVAYYVAESAKRMVAAVAGAPSSVTGSGFTPTGNTVEMYNASKTRYITGLASNGATLTFTVPVDLQPGSYSLRVGALNSHWSRPITVTVTKPVLNTGSLSCTISVTGSNNADVFTFAGSLTGGTAPYSYVLKNVISGGSPQNFNVTVPGTFGTFTLSQFHNLGVGSYLAVNSADGQTANTQCVFTPSSVAPPVGAPTQITPTAHVITTSPSQTVNQTANYSATPTPSLSPSPSPTLTPTPSRIPTPTPTLTPSHSPSPTPSPKPSSTPSPTPTSTSSPTPAPVSWNGSDFTSAVLNAVRLFGYFLGGR